MSPEAVAADRAPREVRLADLRVGQYPVVVTGRVVRAERRRLRRSGEAGTPDAIVGWITDGSATVRFTWWDPPEEPIEAGDGLRAGPVDIRQFRDRVELAFGRRTRVEPVGELELPPDRPEDHPRRSLASLRDGEDELRLDVRVERVRARERSGPRGPRQFFLGELSDASGRRAFAAWLDLGLAEGRSYRLLGASSRSYRDRIEVILDERVRALPLPADPRIDPGSPTGARIVRRSVAAPPPEGPLPAGGEALLALVDRICATSPDGYASLDAIARDLAAGTPGSVDPAFVLAALVKSGRLAEPLAGLYRPGSRPKST